MNKYKKLLKNVDVWYILDVGMYEKGVPQIFYGLRGLVYYELKVKVGDRDLHSGVYGNAVLNPIQVIIELFSKIKDGSTHKVNIPRFYDSVRKLSKEEMSLLRKIDKLNAEKKKESGTYTLTSVSGYSSYLSSKIAPSLEINGIWGGYIGEGTKTVIPREASIKFSIRLVEYQDPKEITKLVKKYIKENIQKGVKYFLKEYGAGADPFFTDINNEEVKNAVKIISDHFKKEVKFNRSGGTVPASEIIQRLFKKPVINTGFTLPDENIHSPNENVDIDMFREGIEVLKKIIGN